jgi:hypothetical protein
MSVFQDTAERRVPVGGWVNIHPSDYLRHVQAREVNKVWLLLVLILDPDLKDRMDNYGLGNSMFDCRLQGLVS